MKLHFEPNLDYQRNAIEAVCGLFHGQETCQTVFTVTQHAVGQQLVGAGFQEELGVGNRLTLLPEQLLDNLRKIQIGNGLAPAVGWEAADFTVEMETGTGKTYVYLRTMFELNKRFGFTKFIIVVPSVAIKEGVFHSIEIAADHLKGLYAGVPFDFFIYDSAKLGQVRNFATSPHIQIMVVTVGAINKKDVNNLYKNSEKTGGDKPIDLVQATRPIVIVDEPQSVDGGLSGAGKTALDAMQPLCTLRYSATHADKYQMVYRLDAVDAYQQKLVKQIEVAAATVEAAHNRPYVRLLQVANKRGTIAARVELDMQGPGGVRTSEASVQDGDLLDQTTGRELYAGVRIGEISVAKGKQFMELRVPGGEHFLQIGESWGGVEALALQREMIRRTIREHLDKEKRLRPQGIKVLSLFFIDKVEKYRSYDADGNAVKGEYAVIFEEEYRRASRLPDYNTLFGEVDHARVAEEVHNGYFSIDRNGGWTNTEENNQGNRDNAERAYNLIMKEKEKLLSFETPLKFIFSHSALREGWDNPNVFQICALREMGTERERRQTIGRGLRLCVNQNGDRLRGFEVNTLTVIAMESYEQFAENLQKEIEEETGIRFGIVEKHQFAGIAVTNMQGETAPLGTVSSEQLWSHLKGGQYLDANGKVQDALRVALKNGTLAVPAEFTAQLDQITQILKKLAGRLEIKNADTRRQVLPRQAVLHGEEFKSLWDRVKHKTTYRVDFDNEKLVQSCIKAVRDAPAVQRSRLQWHKAEVAIGKAGVVVRERTGASTVVLEENYDDLPDLLTDLQDRTQLTRRTIQRVLAGSGRLDDFKRNPQQFIERVGEAVNRCKRLALVDGIKYERLGAGEYYAQELFEEKELSGYLKNLLDSPKSVYEQVVFDSNTEEEFARQLEFNSAIKVYAKLPGWFQVPTPLGTYNPDWAVLVENEGAERLYFVVESKGTMFTEALRATEQAKIECGRQHFKALAVRDEAVQYVVAATVSDVLAMSDRGGA